MAKIRRFVAVSCTNLYGEFFLAKIRRFEKGRKRRQRRGKREVFKLQKSESVVFLWCFLKDYGVQHVNLLFNDQINSQEMQRKRLEKG